MVDIQPVSPTDTSEILDIIVRSFEHYRHTLIPTPSVFRETDASLREKLELGGGYFALAENKRVGFVSYELRETYVYLGRLSVLPEYRGLGIGKALIGAVEGIAHKHHLYQIRLNVRIALVENHTLFESVGFKKIASHKHNGFSEPTYIEMSKNLVSDGNT